MGEQTDVGEIARHQDCLHAANCKPVCSKRAARQPAVFPAQQDPLHLALLIEAFLYEEQ